MKKLFGIKNRKLILLIAAVILVLLGFYLINVRSSSNTLTNPEGWKIYTSTEGNFTISMPLDVSKTSSPSATENMITYNAFDSKKNLYLAQVHIYPYMINTSLSALIADKDLLRKQKSDWTVITENNGKFKEFQTYDLLLKRGNEYIKYRIFEIYNYQYIIGTLSTGKDFSQFEKFANSFELIESNLTPKDIKLLQEFINEAQTSINYWGKAYVTGRYSKQDLDKIIFDDNSIISSCQTILTNLQSGKINNGKNFLLWKSVMNMTDEVDTLNNKLSK